MKYLLFCAIFLPFLLSAQMKESGVAPGASVVMGEHTGVNLRFHYFPSHKMCFGLESNLFPKSGHSVSEGMELTLNGHFILEVSEHWGVYPLVGAGWKNLEHESGFRALTGGGLHGNYGRLAPYVEYIYSSGFEPEGIFIIGTFFTFALGEEH
ncbi:hypothetical protein [Ekhidna sp.]|uniref:hypothetical protein n=1 Tax=Ekhidna sp. TaxID=2608089 RepID=UPI00329824B2